MKLTDEQRDALIMEWRQKAEALRDAIKSALWMEDEGTQTKTLLSASTYARVSGLDDLNVQALPPISEIRRPWACPRRRKPGWRRSSPTDR